MKLMNFIKYEIYEIYEIHEIYETLRLGNSLRVKRDLLK